MQEEELPTGRGYVNIYCARTAVGIKEWVDDGPLQAPEWKITSNRLETATGKSDGAPPPGV